MAKKYEPKSPISDEFFLPNHSGTHSTSLIFDKGAGLPYGIIAGDGETITCTTQNTWYQITFDSVGDTLGCWVRCTSAGAKDVIVDHVSILAVGIGG